MRRLPKYLAEFVGTFCLVFAGTGAIAARQAAGGRITGLEICLAFGLVVVAMVYAVGHISGAHLNPAVTLGFYSGGRLEARELAPYWAGQLAGAVLASAVLRLLFGEEAVRLGATLPAMGPGRAFAMELILTGMLMFVIMAVATDHRAQGAMAGIAIGATVCVAAIIGGPVSGASMNPARSLGPALLGGVFTGHWLYWAAPALGAVAGTLVYRFIQCDLPKESAKQGCC